MERETTLARLRSAAAHRLVLAQHRRDRDGICGLCRVRCCDPRRTAHRALVAAGSVGGRQPAISPAPGRKTPADEVDNVLDDPAAGAPPLDSG